MAYLDMALWGMTVPAGDVAVPGAAAIPAAYRITMAAIDPNAESQGPSDAPLRATLKVFRQPLQDEFEDDEDDDEDDESFDADEMDRILAGGDSESSDDDEDTQGGPSDPAKSKKARKEQAQKEIKKLLEAEGMDVDDDEMPNGVNGAASKSEKALGKMPASDEEDDSEIDSDDEGEIEEFVICTLDTKERYQQPLNLTIGDDERVWFKVTGTHDIHLTGNYIEPADSRPGMYDPDSDEDEDYDMEPGEDELDGSMDEDESVDDLDDMKDPRVTELPSDDEEAPQLAKVEKKKGANKNKRPAEDEAEGGAETLDEMITKEKAVADGVNGEQKLSKKQMKKLKKNDGQAGAAPVVEKTEKVEAEAPSSNGKKVQFAKELEQGPTPTKGDKKDDKSKAALGPKTVNGVIIDDKKLGSGQAAKNGDRISMRYIGKLKDSGKVFDSNKKGKPFSFKLGANEVIKGWEIGAQGIQAGGERRITIPAHHAYGSKRVGDIPPNSALVFDIKALEVGKSGGK